MDRHHNLSSLIISVAVSAIFVPLAAGAAGNTGVSLNTDATEVTKANTVTFNPVKKPVAPSAPIVSKPQKNVVVKTEIKKTATPKIKTNVKPKLKPLDAPKISTTKAPQKPKLAAKPIKAIPPPKTQNQIEPVKGKNTKPIVNKEVGNIPIPNGHKYL